MWYRSNTETALLELWYETKLQTVLSAAVESRREMQGKHLSYFSIHKLKAITGTASRFYSCILVCKVTSAVTAEGGWDVGLGTTTWLCSVKQLLQPSATIIVLAQAWLRWKVRPRSRSHRAQWTEEEILTIQLSPVACRLPSGTAGRLWLAWWLYAPGCLLWTAQ